MKLLHTSDLHFGVQWRRQSRRDDQARVLAEIVQLCDARDVDAVLITGDVFADRVEGGSHPAVMRQLLRQLSPLFKAGRSVFLLRGNHDPFQLFGLARDFLTELQAASGAAAAPPWPLVVADVPDVYTLPIRGGRALQVVALPYVRPAQLQLQARPEGATGEENVAQLSGLLARQLDAMRSCVAAHLPAVFAGHVMIGGAAITPDLTFESGYDAELWLEPAGLPQYTSYNALGHIHLSQELRGAGKPTWYAGAPDRLDLGERAYAPQVLLVTLPKTPGGVAHVEPIPLQTCTPFTRVELDGVQAVEQFLGATACAVAGRAVPHLGEAIVANVPAAGRAPLESRIRAAYPRLDVLWAHDAPEAATAPGESFDPGDVPAVMERYFAEAFGDQPERRARLAAAFQALWQEGDATPGGARSAPVPPATTTSATAAVPAAPKEVRA